MLEKIRSKGARLGLLFTAVFATAVATAGTAMAEGSSPEYGKLTSGITSELDVIVPIVLLALGTVIGITFAVKWAMRRFGGAH